MNKSDRKHGINPLIPDVAQDYIFNVIVILTLLVSLDFIFISSKRDVSIMESASHYTLLFVNVLLLFTEVFERNVIKSRLTWVYVLFYIFIIIFALLKFILALAP